MASRPSTRIARKARLKAESDFATWLMMAKLGSFDDLPPNAQGFLISYRDRLERMSEAESTAVAVREVYASYYSEMGGLGTAPEPEAAIATSMDNAVVRSQGSRKPPPARLAAVPHERSARSASVLLIFAVMVALIVAYRFLTS